MISLVEDSRNTWRVIIHSKMVGIEFG